MSLLTSGLYGACSRGIPSMKSLAEEYVKYNLEVIGVSYDTDATAWRNCVDRYDMRWTHCSELKRWHYDTTTDTAYGIKWFPTLYLVGPYGCVVIATVVMDRLVEAVRTLAVEDKIPKP